MATNRRGKGSKGSKAKLRVINGNAEAGTKNGGKETTDGTATRDAGTKAPAAGSAPSQPAKKPAGTRKTGWGDASHIKERTNRQAPKADTNPDGRAKRSRDVLKVVPGAAGAAASPRGGEAKQEQAAPSSVISKDADTADEYEYVSFSEWIRPFLEWLAYWGDELRVPIIVIALILVLIVTTLVGRMTNTFLIVLAVIIVTLLMSVLIYMAWNSMREARDLYRRAERVYREKNRIEKRSGTDDGVTSEKGTETGEKRKGLFGRSKK